MNFKPLVFIVSGPSGSGKSTLVQKILQLPGTMLSVSSTTRSAAQDGKRRQVVQFRVRKPNSSR